MSILVVGSVAYDSIKTPFGERESALGGSATHFSFAASYFAPVSIIAVVGEDFKEADLVIGANSTVIQEALLMKVPVMGVYNEDYIVSSLVPSPFICQVDKLTGDELNQCMSKSQDDFLIQRLQTNIGIFNTDLTTKLIFDLCVN